MQIQIQAATATVLFDTDGSDLIFSTECTKERLDLVCSRVATCFSARAARSTLALRFGTDFFSDQTAQWIDEHLEDGAIKTYVECKTTSSNC